MTAKEQRFADEYLISGNAKQAALNAGYKENTAKNANYWINEEADAKQVKAGRKSQYKPKLAEYIENELSKMHNKKIASAEEVMEYLSSVARGEQTEQTVRFCGSGLQEVVDIDVSAKDRLKAAELIGKRYGLFKENVNLGETRVVISTDVPEDW